MTPSPSPTGETGVIEVIRSSIGYNITCVGGLSADRTFNIFIAEPSDPVMSAECIQRDSKLLNACISGVGENDLYDVMLASTSACCKEPCLGSLVFAVHVSSLCP